MRLSEKVVIDVEYMVCSRVCFLTWLQLSTMEHLSFYVQFDEFIINLDIDHVQSFSMGCNNADYIIGHVRLTILNANMGYIRCLHTFSAGCVLNPNFITLCIIINQLYISCNIYKCDAY